MATATISRRGNSAYEGGGLRLKLDQHQQNNKIPYEAIHKIPSAKDDLVQRQLSMLSGICEKRENQSQRHTSLNSLKESPRLTTDDGSLTFRSLPPIKISIKQGNNNKLVDYQRVEASGIFQAAYSVKTNRPGHQVFTEGISKISTLPCPTFALKSMQVPYSNLPDNITIHKEKNHFTFGVRSNTDVQMNTSPFKLSEKPTGIGNMDFIEYQELSKAKNKAGTKTDSKGRIRDIVPKIKEKYGFNCKLASTENASSNDLVLDFPYAGQRETVIESFAQELNTVITSKNPTKKANEKHKQRERSVSVVSIGDSVTPTFFDREKRKTRKHYPMYDWKATQKEALTKSKFGVRDVNCAQSNTNKPNINKPMFERSNTRLSTTLLEFDVNDMKENRKQKAPQNSTEKLSPLTQRPKFLSTRQKTTETFYGSDPEFDLNKIYNPKKGRYQLRKIYPKFRKRFHRPSSNSSHSSTDTSTVILNPPPSETGQSLLEDTTVSGGMDSKTDMEALVEERERTATASAFSPPQNKDNSNKGLVKVSGRLDKVMVPITNINNIHAVRLRTLPNVGAVENASKLIVKTENGNIGDEETHMKVNQGENNVPVINETDDKGNNNNVHADQMVQGEQSDNTGSDTNEDQLSKEKSKQDFTTDESDGSDIYGFQRTRMISDFEKTIMEEYREDPGELHKIGKNFKTVKNRSKHISTLLFPTVSLDKLSHYPLLPYNPNNSSLSRTLQNTKVDVPLPRKLKSIEGNGADTYFLNDEKKLRIPVTQIRLSSPATSRSLITPAVSLVDEFRAYQPVFVSNENLNTFSDRDKKLVSSTNISFTSPLVKELKAKRQ